MEKGGIKEAEYDKMHESITANSTDIDISCFLKYPLIYVTGFGKTLLMGFFQKIEFDAWLISSTIELSSSLRPIVCLVVEIQCFVCDRATPPIIEKLWSKGVAIHAYGVSAYCTTRDPEIN